MSIIRQRTKNLIFSGLLGFLIAVLILSLSGYVFRDRLAVVLSMTLDPIDTSHKLVASIVTARPIEKGSVLDENDLKIAMVPEDTSVKGHFGQISDLIGSVTLIDLDENLPMTGPMIADQARQISDRRLYEVSFVELPYLLAVGDVVDVRIAFPTGQEYVVLAKKNIIGFERRVNNVHSGLLNLALEEEEALRMSSAMVDSLLNEGSRVYLVKYVDPVNQVPALVTYPVNEPVMKLLTNNPNIGGTGDLSHMLQSRGALEAALVRLLSEDDLKVDLGTPGMSAGKVPEVKETAMDEADQSPMPVEEETTAAGTGIGF